MEEGITKTVKDVSLTVTDLAPEFQAKAQDIRNTKINVEITGAQSVIEKIKPEDIILAIDLGHVNKPGTYQVPILIKKLDNVNYKLDQEEITIEVVEE